MDVVGARCGGDAVRRAGILGRRRVLRKHAVARDVVAPRSPTLAPLSWIAFANAVADGMVPALGSSRMVIIDFLASLPLWLLGLVLIVWLVGSGLAALWIVRRWVLPRLGLTYDDGEFASAALQCGMLLYALVAALIAVGVWQRYSQVSDVVSSEATSIASLWRDLGGYPEPTRGEARDILRGYTEQIVHEAWPQQHAGQIPSAGVEWMDRLQAKLFAFEPSKDSERILHAESLRAFNTLILHRRERLDCVRSALPGVFWVILLPGAVGCLVLVTFFHINSLRFHAMMITSISMFLSMVLFVIIALDRPFSGAMGIPSDSYQLICDHYMKK
jgi:hypothetical protein